MILLTRDLINMQISRMSELELKTMIVKILAGLERSIEGTTESLSVDKKRTKVYSGQH